MEVFFTAFLEYKVITSFYRTSYSHYGKWERRPGKDLVQCFNALLCFFSMQGGSILSKITARMILETFLTLPLFVSVSSISFSIDLFHY
jgi:hypothetical protein